jgi:hypothetical protein
MASATQKRQRRKPNHQAAEVRPAPQGPEPQQAAAEPLAQPATTTPPANGHQQPELWPAANGAMRVWLCCRDERGKAEAYRLSLARLVRGREKGWAMQKASDGTTYHLLEVWNPATRERELSCDCPGAAAHGRQCNGGKGCKHMRALRALRALAAENGK